MTKPNNSRPNQTPFSKRSASKRLVTLRRDTGLTAAVAKVAKDLMAELGNRDLVVEAVRDSDRYHGILKKMLGIEDDERVLGMKVQFLRKIRGSGPRTTYISLATAESLATTIILQVRCTRENVRHFRDIWSNGAHLSNVGLVALINLAARLRTNREHDKADFDSRIEAIDEILNIVVVPAFLDEVAYLLRSKDPGCDDAHIDWRKRYFGILHLVSVACTEKNWKIPEKWEDETIGKAVISFKMSHGSGNARIEKCARRALERAVCGKTVPYAADLVKMLTPFLPVSVYRILVKGIVDKLTPKALRGLKIQEAVSMSEKELGKRAKPGVGLV